MSVFTPTKTVKKQQKVHNSEYIKTENEPEETGTTPTEPTTPQQPETK